MIIAMPTKSGILLVIASLAAAGSAVMNVGFSSAMIASLLGAVTLSCFLMAQFSLYGIRVERKPNCDGVCGTEITLPLVVTNRFVKKLDVMGIF